MLENDQSVSWRAALCCADSVGTIEDRCLRQPSVERGGRAKRFVHVTEKGLRAIDEARTTLNRLWRDVPAFGKDVTTWKAQ